MGDAIVFFDGTCGLCNGFVDFLLTRDRRHRFKMSPLQGETAARLLPAERPDSIILFENGQTWVRSEAILRILAGLGGLWRLSFLFRVIPLGLSNALYDGIARRRYGWFGKRDTCRLPTVDEQTRFLP